MRLCVLLEVYDDPANAEADLAEDGDPREYLSGHDTELHFLSKADAVAQVTALVARGFDVFVNLCGGSEDEDDRPGVEVIQALHRLGAAYTGAEADFYCADRRDMKAACARCGVLTPGGVFIESPADIESGLRQALDRLHFPLLVKHPNSYASIGLTPDSRVLMPEALEEQTRRMVGEYGRALIEEFIDGREFTVLVAENPENRRAPVVYEPLEFCFPPGESFKHYNLKWYDYNRMSTAMAREPALARHLKSAARRLFLAMRGSSYARFDFRVDAAGRPFVVDVNPNCGIFYPRDNPGSADMILLHAPGGHAAFVDLILRTALRRAEQRRRATRRSTDSSRRDAAGYAPESIPCSACSPPTE